MMLLVIKYLNLIEWKCDLTFETNEPNIKRRCKGEFAYCYSVCYFKCDVIYLGIIFDYHLLLNSPNLRRQRNEKKKSSYVSTLIRYGILLCVSAVNQETVFILQNKAIWSNTLMKPTHSFQGLFKQTNIITLSSLYV